MERPADEREIRKPEVINYAPTELDEAPPLIESGLTIEEVAERLGISEEAACALVAASLRRSSREGEK